MPDRHGRGAKTGQGQEGQGNQQQLLCGRNAKVAWRTRPPQKTWAPSSRPAPAPGTNMLTDGWAGYIELGKDFVHEAIILTNPKDVGIRLPLIHIQFANLKSWIAGTFHDVSPKHLPAICRSGNYQFNRRGIISNLFGHLMILPPLLTKRSSKTSIQLSPLMHHADSL